MRCFLKDKQLSKVKRMDLFLFSLGERHQTQSKKGAKLFNVKFSLKACYTFWNF